MEQIYQGLHDIDEVERFDPEKDKPLFEELRAVLAKHNALNRFGVTLLHTHFEFHPGERMREVCDVDTRTLTSAPTSEALPSKASVIETNWRFLPDGMGATQLCFADCLVSNGKHKEIHKKQK
jgi:hypothetical protein